MTDVSILVPTKNGAAFIGELLERAMRGQQTRRSLEAIVVDSGSRDQTRAIAARAGATVHEIPPRAFNHGTTRNLLARLARGTYLVFLSQDALPADENWLENLVRPLDDDVLIAGVYSAHRPRLEADPVQRYLVAHEWRLVGERFPPRRNEITSWREYEANLAAYVYFANTCAAIRRSVWEEIPFRPVEFGEDADWARRVLEAGYATVFQPSSVVVHSHAYGLSDAFRRSFEHAHAFQTMFGVGDRRPLWLRLVDAMLLTVRIARAEGDARPNQLGLVARALAQLGVQEVGSWLGGRGQVLPAGLRRALQLQPSRLEEG